MKLGLSNKALRTTVSFAFLLAIVANQAIAAPDDEKEQRQREHRENTHKAFAKIAVAKEFDHEALIAAYRTLDADDQINAETALRHDLERATEECMHRKRVTDALAAIHEHPPAPDVAHRQAAANKQLLIDTFNKALQAEKFNPETLRAAYRALDIGEQTITEKALNYLRGMVMIGSVAHTAADRALAIIHGRPLIIIPDDVFD